jgi:ribonuclease BN (tRNA processing enzyme)
MKAPYVALGLRVESAGRTLAFSGDTGPHDGLAAIADGAELFVCECSLATPDPEGRHLSVEDVARLAPGWNAKRVVLVHLSAAARLAAAALPGVEVGDDGMIFDL